MATTKLTGAPECADHDRPPAPLSAAAVERAAEAEKITGFRIMRETEVAPGWWGTPREIGDTGSATVADSFCREQNAVTMDANRQKRIQYFADPIYGDTGETTHRPTAPLPRPAVDALARLERAFPSAEVIAAVTRFETAAARYDELVLSPAELLTADEIKDFENAQQEMTDAMVVLAEAGRMDLLAPLSIADHYRSAKAHYRRLAAARDFEGCEYVRDEMTDCLCQLKAAGRLDLIGVTR